MVRSNSSLRQMPTKSLWCPLVSPRQWRELADRSPPDMARSNSNLRQVSPILAPQQTPKAAARFIYRSPPGMARSNLSLRQILTKVPPPISLREWRQSRRSQPPPGMA
eukprot:6906202-Pyramimonas_sp.AAC.1